MPHRIQWLGKGRGRPRGIQTSVSTLSGMTSIPLWLTDTAARSCQPYRKIIIPCTDPVCPPVVSVYYLYTSMLVGLPLVRNSWVTHAGTILKNLRNLTKSTPFSVSLWFTSERHTYSTTLKSVFTACGFHIYHLLRTRLQNRVKIQLHKIIYTSDRNHFRTGIWRNSEIM